MPGPPATPRRHRLAPPALVVAAAALAGALACAAANVPVAEPAAAAPGVAADGHDATLSPADARTQARLDAHLDFLADDLLRGRLTGTPEYEIAARYVAAELQLMGLQPIAGESYLLPVPLRAAELDREAARFEVVSPGGRRALDWGTHFLMSPVLEHAASELEAEVVYVGYGISAPERGWDDYAGVDVRGKVVLLARGTPAGLPADERAYHSNRRYHAAAEHGAVGILTMRNPAQPGMPWERAVANAGKRPSLDWVGPDGTTGDGVPQLLVGASLSDAGLDALLAAGGHDPAKLREELAGGYPKRFPLGVTVRLAQRSRHRQVTSSNVGAILPGSDPQLAGEVVVFTAHLDHTGVGAERDGDAINNGYYDNAMGTALMLEAARAFAGAPRAPRRTLLFLAVTGEESGLLGSDWFAAHPPAGLGRMVANVNLDMPLFLHPVADLVAFGAEHSSLGGVVAKAAAEAGFTVSPDPVPEEVIFVRSDQYSFVRQGIPAVFLVTGFGSTDPEVDGAKANKGFMEEHYHAPSDEVELGVHWPSAVRFLAANVALARAIADAPHPPRWNPGDYFGEKFGKAGR